MKVVVEYAGGCTSTFTGLLTKWDLVGACKDAGVCKCPGKVSPILKANRAYDGFGQRFVKKA